MKIIIRPETPSEYNEVDNVIYEAFSGQHGIETGKFMKRHFADERRKIRIFRNCHLLLF